MFKSDKHEGTEPKRETDLIVRAGGLRWHVRTFGQGPPLLLVHGTGSSAQTWRRLVPLLQNQFTIIIPDLPGHAQTQNPGAENLTLPGMASALSALMKELAVEPMLVAGHSAGAAIAVRAVLNRELSPRAIVSFNGALLPFTGVAGRIFSPLAKLLVTQPWVPRLMTWRAGSRNAVAQLLRDTGSRLAEEDIDIYARLFQDRDHVAATLTMMANWNLEPLARDMRDLAVPLFLITGDNDKAIPPADAERAAKIVQRGQVISLPGLGHLAHEERPDLAAGAIVRAASDVGAWQPKAHAPE